MRQIQAEIIKTLHVQPNIDPAIEFRKSVDFLKGYLTRNKASKALVLGLSGGQDSTLAGFMCQTAINELNLEQQEQMYEFIAVRLPYGIQLDEQDCLDAIQFIKPSRVITVNIQASVDASFASVPIRRGEKADFLKGNVKARERMKVQYDIAGATDGLVVGTDHAAEAVTGFFTKFGDGAADILPLYRLNKRQGKQILKELGCPEHLYTKTPTADLEDNKPQIPDETALGLRYDVIDDYLEGKEIDYESAERIEARYVVTKHKRLSPVTLFDPWQ